MFFHFVKKSDNLYDLSNKYEIELEQIIEDNSLINPNELVINQCLLINKDTYRVKKGDNLYQISKKFNLSIDYLKMLNPNIKENYLLENQIINLKNINKTNKVFNGYIYEFSSYEKVKKAIPFMTYLSIFSYKVDIEGNLNEINDEKFIQLAKEYNVKPIMVITNLKDKGGFSSQIVTSILNEDKMEKLFNNIEKILISKGYYGLNIDFEYIDQNDKEKFINFVEKANRYFKNKGYYLSIAVAPKSDDNQKGILYEAHDYEKLGVLVDNVIIMTYEWGYTYGPSMAVSPINEVKKVLEYAVNKIEKNKILMGIPNYGYDFIIPYSKNNKAKSITNSEAIVIAYNNHSQIERNEKSLTPYFKYKNNLTHEVQFDDPLSFEEKLALIDQYDIGGGSIWTLNNECQYLYLHINNGYIIKK